MTTSPSPFSPNQYLQAGLIYLVVIASGLFSLGYVPTHTQVSGDPAATARLLCASEGLFRLGLISDLLLAIAFLLLPFALFRLLYHHHPPSAGLMLGLAVLAFPMALWNLSPKLDILSAVRGSEGFPALGGEELASVVSRALQAHRQGLLIQQVCWGAWLIPLGRLVSRASIRFRLLGHLLVVGGIGYLIHVVGTLGWPGYKESSIPQFIRLPASLAEFGLCAALLFMGFTKATAKNDAAKA